MVSTAESKTEYCELSVYKTGDRGGNISATGERLSDKAFTAAHKSIPFGHKTRITNIANGKDVIVRINDRGPFVRGRCIDVRPIVAKAIGCNSTCRVKVED